MIITKEKIHEIAAQLDKDGERPTLARIRKRLGGGSFTTITEAMKQYRDDKVVPAQVVAIPDEVTAATTTVWQLAQKAAQAQLEDERKVLATDREDMAKKADDMESQVEALNATIQSNEQAVSTLREQLTASNTQLAVITSNCDMEKLGRERAESLADAAQLREEKISDRLDVLQTKLIEGQ